jgi:hypothetical protein
MQMIDVLKRLAELDSANPQVETIAIKNEQSLATVSNIEGETITESISECGPMGMSSMGGMDRPSTPATFSINASAESGDEVSSMLRDIMNLAGVKPAMDEPAFGGAHQEIELEPVHSLEMEPAQSAGDEMGDLIGMVDRMNGAAGDDVSVAQGDVDGDGDHDMADHEAEKTDSPVAKMADEVRDMAGELADEGQGIAAGFDKATTTPDEKVEPHKYGNDQVTPKPKEPAKVNGGGNPYAESQTFESLSAHLLTAYETFKKQQ